MSILSNFRSRFISRLPLVLVVTLLVGNAVFCALSVFPAWTTHDRLTTDLEAQQTAAAAPASTADVSGLAALEAQISSAEDELGSVGDMFLTEAQVNELFDRLYAYAAANNVVITNFQTYRGANSSEENPLYQVRLFRMQVNGDAPQLMNFVVQIREATTPGVSISSVNLTGERNSSILALDIEVYTSDMASGEAFASGAPLADVTMAAAGTQISVETVNAANSAATLTVTPQPETGSGDVPTGQPGGLPSGETNPNAVAANPTATPAPIVPQVEGENAPPIRFEVGDWAIVDFNGQGALRVMDRVDGGASYSRAQIYDNQPLRILAGPVCGDYSGANIWYWYIEYGQIRGWVGEGPPDDPWLCTLDEPECATG
jgi:hypothetical protein